MFSFELNPSLTFFFLVRFPNLQFEYKDPEKNFDHSKVHGLVARLIKVKDLRNATALEVTAGRKVNKRSLGHVKKKVIGDSLFNITEQSFSCLVKV